jgi:hypothetical protein
MYYHELNIKEMIHSRVGVPLGAISIVIAMMTYMISNVSLPENNMKYIFYILLGVCSLVSVISLLLLGHMIIIKGSTYAYIPRPAQIEKQVMDLEKAYNDYSSKEELPYTKEQYISSKLDKFLYPKYKEATEKNLLINESRLKCLRFINIAIIIALITGFFAGIAFYYLNEDKTDKSQKVEVIICK